MVGAKESEALWEQVQPSDFFNIERANFWMLIKSLHDDGIALNPLEIWERISADQETSRYPTLSEIADFGTLVHKLAPASRYLSILRDRACRRRLSSVLHNLEENLDTVSFGAAMESMQVQLGEIVKEQVELAQEGKTDFDAARNLLDTLETRAEAKVYCDIPALDERTGGFFPGELIVATAETGAGKTLLAQQTKRRACRDGYVTLYCSAEMSAEHLVSRVVAADAGVAPSKMRNPERISADEWERLIEIASHSCQHCRIMDGVLDMAHISTFARKMAARSTEEKRLRLIVLDYDELIEAPGDTENERITSIVRSAKTLAIETQTVVMLVSQLRKEQSNGNDKAPTLSRLYGSGSKIKHATAVLHIDRPYVRNLKGDQTEAAIYILKFRDGGVGFIPVSFNVRTLRFDEAPPSEADSTEDRPERSRRSKGGLYASET